MNIVNRLIFGHFLMVSIITYPHLGIAQNRENPQTPVILTTDLWLPHGDPDDHFDLLTLLSVPVLDVKAVIIDHTMQANVARTKIDKVPNFAVVEKAASLFERKPISVEAGLKEPLTNINDDGRNRPKKEQLAIELIIDELRGIKGKNAVIITTGSLRDVHAAYNRESELFRTKVKGIYISLGDSYGTTGTGDTNVAKDIEAWKGIMTSGLPVFWMPTNPSKRRGGVSRYVSHWYFVQEELLAGVPKALQEFFLSERIDLAIKSWQPVRSMWSTPAFIEAAGLNYYQVNNEFKWLSKEQAEKNANAKLCNPYTFVPIKFSMDAQGVIEWEVTDEENATNMHIFKVNDYYLYNESMYQFLKDQFDSVNSK